ncbi:MAG: Eco57I restriction-modification methylase domain-containing protein [bacterium]|nr:Eco57I restriction-modification methylase domain-containing protein [bacterium]
MYLKLLEFDPFKETSCSWFDAWWMFGIKDGFDIVIGNPPYGVPLSANEKAVFKKHYISTNTTKAFKGSIDSYTIFIEKGFILLRQNGNLHFIIPISITSSESVSSLHNLLESNCKQIQVSSYSVRPQPVFENAVVNTSILFFTKTNTKNESILSTKMYRKNTDFNLQHLVDNLEFIDVKNYTLIGRYPKISYQIEKNILDKVFKCQTKIRNLVKENGKSIFYRTTGGRYYKVVTNYPTGSTKEKPIRLEGKYSNSVGAILSSNLFFWFYQIFSNNLDLKLYEIEEFGIPTIKLDNTIISKLERTYEEYLKDIEKNSNIRKTKKYANIDSFKEYKIGKSKNLIDAIDDIICPLYGLTKEEIKFIKEYEIEFRLQTED